MRAVRIYLGLLLMSLATALVLLAASRGAEASVPASCTVDTDGDGIADCVDTSPNKPSWVFAAPPEVGAPPDVCMTPGPVGLDGIPIPFPYALRYGLRAVLSNFSDPTQGPLGDFPVALALDALGNIVSLNTSRGLYRINLLTGVRSVISDFEDLTQGDRLVNPKGLAVAPSGEIFVIASSNFGIDLYKVNPSTGVRALVSDFSNGAQGPLSVDPVAVAVDATGSIVVADRFAAKGVLFRVDPQNGFRTILSDFASSAQGPLGASPSAVTFDHLGNIFVADAGTLTLYKVAPTTGVRTIVSNFQDPSQGAVAIGPLTAVAVEASGGILVLDPSYGDDFRGALFFVDPSSGIRQILSDFGSSTQGLIGTDPRGLVIGPDHVYVADLHGGPDFFSPATIFKVELHTATSGTIVSKGDQNLKVTAEESDSKTSIKITAEATTTNPEPATVAVDGAHVTLSLHKSFVLVSLGSVITEVVSGPVDIQFLGDMGAKASATLGTGNTIEFEPKTLSFKAPQTNSDAVVVLVDGRDLTVRPGGTVVAFANVEIDIKPGSDPNCFNNNGQGVIPVAILSRVDFDATRVDPSTVSLDGQAVRVVGKKGNVQAHIEDVNRDGLADLVLQIVDKDGTYKEGDTTAILTGKTFDGTAIQGTDTICIVP